MTAFQQLLLRGLLAGRRVAMAPAQARPAFSTTTGGIHFSQIHWRSLDQAVQESIRVQRRSACVWAAVFAVLLYMVSPVASERFATFLESKSVVREGKS